MFRLRTNNFIPTPFQELKLALNPNLSNISKEEKSALEDFCHFRRAFKKQKYHHLSVFQRTPELSEQDIPDLINDYFAKRPEVSSFIIKKLFHFFKSHPQCIEKLNAKALYELEIDKFIYSDCLAKLANPTINFLINLVRNIDARYPEENILNHFSILMRFLPDDYRERITTYLLDIASSSIKFTARVAAAILLAKLFKHIPEKQHLLIYSTLKQFAKSDSPFLNAISCFTLTLMTCSETSSAREQIHDVLSILENIAQHSSLFPRNVALLCHVRLTAPDKTLQATWNFYKSFDPPCFHLKTRNPWYNLSDSLAQAICYEFAPDQETDVAEEKALDSHAANQPQNFQVFLQKLIPLSQAHTDLLVDACSKSKDIPDLLEKFSDRLGKNRIDLIKLLIKNSQAFSPNNANNDTRVKLIMLVAEFQRGERSAIYQQLSTTLQCLPDTLCRVVLSYL